MATEQLVYIVDDDGAIRESLSALLEAYGYIVGTFASARHFLHAAPTLRTGVLITDVRMPDMDGLELQQRLAERTLKFPLIVITAHADVPLAVRAMKAGAVDLLEKPFPIQMVVDSVALAVDQIAATSAEDQSQGALRATAAARLTELSPREREVLDGLLNGLPNKLIAYQLGISARTVEIHRARVMEKTRARSLSELIRMSLAAGMHPTAAP